jgi:glucoamylase
MALEAYDDAIRIANYLMSTQEADGKWSQNMWLEGEPYWKAVQMDQVALPLLLIETCHSHKLIDSERMKRYWPIIKKAISFLIMNGPATQQDRWEQQPGLSPYTLATEVAGLLAGAQLAEINKDEELAGYCYDTADYWNANIERWTYAEGTELAKQYGVAGYYVRINPYNQPLAAVKDKQFTVHHHKAGEGTIRINEDISVDALALVRFGLRAPDDERILNTIRLIDATLKIETPTGPCWHRFSKDGYGEDAKGEPFTNYGTGIGRGWPLLTGERAHYELAAGNIAKAKALLKTMESFANNELLPEQIWDTNDIPEKDLFFGKHSQSAMPLTWAHAEYLKLSRSIQRKKVFDMPAYTSERYIRNKKDSPYTIWRFNWMTTEMPGDKTLRIEVLAPATIHWSNDGWQTIKDVKTRPVIPGLHMADIPPGDKNAGAIQFTFFWPEANHWENKDYEVRIKQ